MNKKLLRLARRIANERVKKGELKKGIGYQRNIKTGAIRAVNPYKQFIRAFVKRVGK